MARLKGKTAIITGGARGMGAATSKLFAAEGAKVAITDVLENEGNTLAKDIGDAARFYKHDVTSEAGWASVVQAAEKDLGPVDILVNNAGILLFKTLLETSLEEYERVLRVNLSGQFLGIKAVAPGMIARGKGAIVNISSSDGMKGANGLTAYSSSKWGVRGLTRCAAMELGHKGIRVNSVHPGGVNTFMANADKQDVSEVNKRFTDIPLLRVGEPEEIAAVSLFLASDDSSYLNAAEIAVDGGMLAGKYYMNYPGAPSVG